MMIKLVKILISLLMFIHLTFSGEEPKQEVYNLSAGIGVNLFNCISLTDYLNSLTVKRYDDFLVNPEFFISIGRKLNNDYSLNLDYTYIVNSFNIDNLTGNIQNHLYLHVPMLMVLRNYKMNNAIIKLGAGAGYSYAILSRRIFYTQFENYYSYGLGIKFMIDANTPFGDNFYGLITGDLKIFLMKEMINANSEKLTFRYGNKYKNLDLDFFKIGLKFGLIYYF